MAEENKYNKTFLQAESYDDAKEALEEIYEANPDAVIFVEEEGKECLIEHGKEMKFVPSGVNLEKIKEIDNKEEKFEVGKGLEMTADRTLNVTLDTTPFTVVDTLPAQPASGNEGKLHLVPNSEGEDDNLFDEYLWAWGNWEKIGSSKLDVDLKNYPTFDDVFTKNKNGLVDKSYYWLLTGIYNEGCLTGVGVYNVDITATSLGITFSYRKTDVAASKVLTLPIATDSKAGVMSASDKQKLDSTLNNKVLTQSDYDSLDTKDPNTLYIITE